MPLHAQVILYRNMTQPRQCMVGSTDIEVTQVPPNEEWVPGQVWVNVNNAIQHTEVLSCSLPTSTLIRPYCRRGFRLLKSVFGAPPECAVELCDMCEWVNVSDQQIAAHAARLREQEANAYITGTEVQSILNFP